MNTSTSLITQINQYLDHLDNRQKKAVLGVVKAFAQEHKEDDIWADSNFVAEIERRTHELENDTSKGYSWNEVKKMTRQSLDELKRSAVLNNQIYKSA